MKTYLVTLKNGKQYQIEADHFELINSSSDKKGWFEFISEDDQVIGIVHESNLAACLESTPAIIFEHGTAKLAPADVWNQAGDFKSKTKVESAMAQINRSLIPAFTPVDLEELKARLKSRREDRDRSKAIVEREVAEIQKRVAKKAIQDLAFSRAISELTSRLTEDQKAALASPPLSEGQFQTLLHSLQKRSNTTTEDTKQTSQKPPQATSSSHSILPQLCDLIIQYWDSAIHQASEHPQVDSSPAQQAPQKPKD